MPLSTGAIWPSLINRTASAADVNSKFEWLEGHRYPMSSGIMTSSTFDIGTSSYKWNNAYFQSIAIVGETISSSDTGPRIKMWGSFNVSGGTMTALETYKVGAINYSPSFPGKYQITCSDWGFTFGSFYYGSVCVTARSSDNIISVRDKVVGIGFTNFQLQTRTTANINTDSSFNFIGVAYLP